MNQPPTKYSHKTRIGNWSEEWELEETKLKDFLKNKDKSSLTSSKLSQKLNQSLIRASLTYSKDGILRFGDRVMCLNKKTNGYLVTDVHDPIATNDEAYNVSTSAQAFPCARSVFIIKKYEKDLHQDNSVHYGQKVQLLINPLLVKKQLYLHSCHVSPTHVAKLSRKQEVGFYAKGDYNTVFEIEHWDPKTRFEHQGLPVKIGEPILFKHCQTAQWLGSDDSHAQKNDFGVEFEVYGHSHQTLNKTQNLIAEKTGRTTIDIPSRNQLDQNCWAVITASDPSQEFDENELMKPLQASDYVAVIRKKLKEKGSFGIRSLLNHFKKIDLNQNGVLEIEDLKWALRNFGIFLSEEEVQVVFNAFDKNKNGVVDFLEFIEVLKGPLSSQRGDLIQNAYTVLVQKLNQNVTFENLLKTYDAAHHPDVVRQLKNEREAFKEFADSWGIKEAEQFISFEDFYAFYSDLSATVDSDFDFEKIIKSTWQLK